MSQDERAHPESTSELLASTARALLDWRPDGAITAWNPGAERLFGHRAADALGRHVRDLLGEAPALPDPASRAPAGVLDLSCLTADTRCSTKDGRSIACRWTYAILRDPSGAPRAIAGEVEDIAERERSNALIRASHDLQRMIFDNSISLVFVKDIDRRYIFVNATMARSFGRHPMELIGKTDVEVGLVPPEIEAEWAKKDQEVIDGGVPVRFEEIAEFRGEMRHFLTVKFPIFDEQRRVVGLCGAPTDITSLKRAEAERAALQEQIIATQKEALRELQTPLIPIADQVLAMPIVGSVDGARAAQIMEALLKGITEMRAHTAILDITGVRGMNAEVAEALVRTARAARLLGARVVLTGIGPDVASALVDLRVDTEGIVTRGTFQSALAFALAG